SVKFEAPKAKEAKGVLDSLSKIKGYERLGTKKANAAIIALDKKAAAVEKSFRNFGNVAVEEFRNINPVSVLNHTFLIVANPAESLKALTAKK
ncbi:MAG: 50S ribosomal protein L4, partial [Patescibacteria group bacterium]|nr:50S ribosomal protein L4 [Patescibacteria group bacterium]